METSSALRDILDNHMDEMAISMDAIDSLSNNINSIKKSLDKGRHINKKLEGLIKNSHVSNNKERVA